MTAGAEQRGRTPTPRRERRKTLCFDLDGTLCSNTQGEYATAEPHPWAIERVNALARAGHRIVVFTARGTATGIDWDAVTRDQLERWGVLYDELRFGKPSADVYVDDRAVHTDAWRVSHGFSPPGFGAETAPAEGDELPLSPPPQLASVVETGRTYGGRVLRLEQHAARAAALASLAGIAAVPSPADIESAVRRALGAVGNGEDLVFVISVVQPATQDQLHLLGAAGPSAGLHVTCRRLEESAAALRPLLANSDGPAVAAAPLPAEGAWPLAPTAGGGLRDALGGDLGLVRDGSLRLSPAHTLPSVARSWLEDLAARLGVGVTHAELTLAGLTGADEAFVAGMPFCLLPLAAVGDERPAADAPGPVTARLLAAWSEEAGIDIAAQTAALADGIKVVS